jgi:hypothetical protein
MANYTLNVIFRVWHGDKTHKTRTSQLGRNTWGNMLLHGNCCSTTLAYIKERVMWKMNNSAENIAEKITRTNIK